MADVMCSMLVYGTGIHFFFAFMALYNILHYFIVSAHSFIIKVVFFKIYILVSIMSDGKVPDTSMS